MEFGANLIQETVAFRSDKLKRPIRNKRINRKAAFGEEKRPPKRLFTPEIKRYLKDWLIRRRDNPYPNRDEKKMLAVQTGLTYIQVCNWFANWRRKLKNAGREPQRRTWGELIKTYNSQVQGNVEHFSISSNDSIWEEPDDEEELESFQQRFSRAQIDHCYGQYYNNNNNNNTTNQCYLVSSTTQMEPNPFAQQPNSKYKNHIMEKYRRENCENSPESEDSEDKPSMIAKWLQSAERFRPNEGNYYIEWPFAKSTLKKRVQSHEPDNNMLLHGKEELDAAEALTSLANARKY